MGERKEHKNQAKLYIIGSVASGKTTLAKKLSKLLNTPWYELDNVVHLRLSTGDVKRSPEEIDFEFNKIINSEKWIIEGVIRKYFNDGFEKADTIILLDTPSYIRRYRILKRWARQKLKIEKANYTPTIKMLLLMYKWSKGFDKQRQEVLKDLTPYKEKVITITDVSDLPSLCNYLGYSF